MTKQFAKDGSSFCLSLTDGRVHKRHSMSQYMRARNYSADSVVNLPVELFPFMSSTDLAKNLEIYEQWQSGKFDAKKAQKVVGQEPRFKDTPIPKIAEVSQQWKDMAKVKMESSDPKDPNYTENRWAV